MNPEGQKFENRITSESARKASHLKINSSPGRISARANLQMNTLAQKDGDGGQSGIGQWGSKYSNI
jgi:hypothetical protein